MSSAAKKKTFSSEVEMEEQPDLILIRLPKEISKEFHLSLESNFKTWVELSKKLYVIDFNFNYDVSRNVLSALSRLIKELSSKDKKVASINVTTELERYLKEIALISSFFPVKDLNIARKAAGLSLVKPKSRVDAEFLKPFIEATQNTLETQVGVKLQAGKPFAKGKGEKLNIDIAGVVNLSCPEFKGAIALCFASATFLNIYEKMVGEKHTSITEEVKDAAGEILNIIFGQAKTTLKNKGYGLSSVIPTVLTGSKLNVGFRTSSSAIILPFKTDLGEFHIEIAVDLD
ncbi:MAG: chemotaxis protein CheX [Bdellovibrionaceae bacterium]|nr:chemotaxis protein CheX [Pseudobdellovibrionaceae bacterium]